MTYFRNVRCEYCAIKGDQNLAHSNFLHVFSNNMADAPQNCEGGSGREYGNKYSKKYPPFTEILCMFCVETKK
jgi:hypothetical protein